jgi:pSer/pThr/pTyr-binding forkhead associated (FHA) protein
MKVQLLSCHSRFLIDRLPALVGRSAQADIRLHDCEVSRSHCRLEERNGVLLIRDVGSKNGTFVNGLRVVESVLVSGDRVTLGQTHLAVLCEPDPSRSARSDLAQADEDSVSHSGPRGMRGRVSIAVDCAAEEDDSRLPPFPESSLM